jgi:hypothetical protein
LQWVLFLCRKLFCTIAKFRIKCVTETKNASVLLYKNLKSSFLTRLAHLTLRFLYILGCSGPWWAATTASRSCAKLILFLLSSSIILTWPSPRFIYILDSSFTFWSSTARSIEIVPRGVLPL